MALVIFIIIFTIVFGLAIAKFRKSSIMIKSTVFGLSFAFSLGLAIFSTDFYVVVEPGEVAVYRDLFNGVLDRVDGPGIHLKMPFIQKAEIFDKRLQSYTMSIAPTEGNVYGNDSLQTKTSDGQDVWVDLTVFFQINPEKTPQIWDNIGQDYEEIIIRPTVRGEARLIITNYSAEGLYTAEKRADAQLKMEDTIRPILEKQGIILDRITIRNIEFSPTFSESIEAKQVEAQHQQQVAIEVETFRAEQEKQVIQAQNEFEAAKLRAQSIQAISNALKDNPEYIQYLFVQNLSPNINWGVLPDSVVPLLDMQQLTNAQ